MEKIVMITGATKGIGKALAEVFACHGYSLLLLARSTEELQAVQNELKTRYQTASKILSVDLAKPEGVNQVLEAFKTDLPNVEILINNAGFGKAKKFTDMTPEEVNGMLELNIATLTRLTYHILPYMTAKKRGRVVNLASTAAFAPGPFMAMYYASKAYVLSFSKALYEEYKEDGISITAVCPGMTITPFHQRAGTNKTFMVSKLNPSMTAEKVAEIAYKGILKNRRVIVTGLGNKFSHVMMWLMPDALLAKITALLDKPRPA